MRNLFLLLLGVTLQVQAETYILPPLGVDLVGETQVTYANYEDTLMDMARRHGLGYDEMLQANPSVDRWLPGEGTPVMLPTRFILPAVPREGIVLNLPEKRLYYFPKPEQGEKARVMTFPAGIGRMDWATPLGVTKVIKKTANPSWRPPESIKAEHLAEYGEVLPDIVPPGPDNPLGDYAMRLGLPGYLIHGTNKRDGVGSRVSHGCVRLYPEGIEELFNQVPVGTPVHIINQPVKAGWLAGTLFLEAHSAFDENDGPNEATLERAIEVIQTVTDETTAATIDLANVARILQQANGLPIAILN